MEAERIETLRQRLSREAGPAVWNAIDRACRLRVAEGGNHGAWAKLCEEAGLVDLARREWQLALRDEPEAEEPALRLAQSHRERGEPGKAARLLEGLVARRPADEGLVAALLEALAEDGAFVAARAVLERAAAAGLERARVAALAARLPAEGEPGAALPGYGDADVARFAVLFSGREDVHARQWSRPGGETGYAPVREPLTHHVARSHLAGGITVGTYPIRLDGTCTFFAVDLDITRAALERAATDRDLARRLRDTMRGEGLRLREVMQALGLEVLFEDSGYKGRHYWAFLEVPESADVLARLGRGLLAHLGAGLAEGLHLEFFPKQAAVKGAGLGNLIKLLLGLHRRTGRRSALLGPDGQPVADPFAMLRGVKRVGREALYRVVDALKGLAGRDETAAAGPAPPETAPAWTEADFEADPRMRHLLRRCPVIAELKRQVDQHRRLSHEEQLVLIHTLGHLPGGPQAVNYLLRRCVDVGPEKLMKGVLSGNPVSCASIRKKIGHLTRRVACNCTFPQAEDRYPTPGLHLIGLPMAPPRRKAGDEGTETLARRYGVLTRQRAEIEAQWRAMDEAMRLRLRGAAGRVLACEGGRYRLAERQGVEEVVWDADTGTDRAGDAAAPGGGTAGGAAGGGAVADVPPG